MELMEVYVHSVKWHSEHLNSSGSDRRLLLACNILMNCFLNTIASEAPLSIEIEAILPYVTC